MTQCVQERWVERQRVQRRGGLDRNSAVCRALVARPNRTHFLFVQRATTMTTPTANSPKHNLVGQFLWAYEFYSVHHPSSLVTVSVRSPASAALGLVATILPWDGLRIE